MQYSLCNAKITSLSYISIAQRYGWMRNISQSYEGLLHRPHKTKQKETVQQISGMHEEEGRLGKNVTRRKYKKDRGRQPRQLFHVLVK